MMLIVPMIALEKAMKGLTYDSLYGDTIAHNTFIVVIVFIA